MPKLVYSRTLQHVDWNATIVREIIPEDVQKLKEQPGGDMVIGGANLAATFTRLNLIDEYRIYIQPVVLGAAIPCFRHHRRGCTWSSRRPAASATEWSCCATSGPDQPA